MRLRAILFDLDDTLTDDYISMEQSVSRAAELVAPHCRGFTSAEIAAAYWRESEIVWMTFARAQQHGIKAEQNTGDRLRFESWHRALCACGVEDAILTRRVVDDYARLRDETLCLTACVPELLQRLRASCKTAIITNGPLDLGKAKLTQFGLSEMVDYCVISEAFGIGKPHPAIFRHVTEKLGVAPTECIMIGDLIELDIFGAQQLGMKGVWLNKRGLPLPEEVQPDFVIDDLRGLLDILRCEGCVV